MRTYILCFALTVVALNAADARADDAKAVRPKSASPYEIARLVNRSNAQLEKSDDESRRDVDVVDLSRTWKRLGIPPGDFETCLGICKAGIFLNELDGERGREVLLKLRSGAGDSFRYLVFKRAARGRWRLLGFVDHDFNRYEESSHRVLRARGRNWLVIRGQEGSGSGYALYAETWYEVGAKGLRPVLYYPVAGGVVPWPSGVSREFRARVTGVRGGAAAVALSYSVSYAAVGARDNRYKKLFRNRFRARYVWDKRRREFAFDRARSNISEAEIYAVAELQFGPEEEDKIGGSVFYKEGDAWKRGGYDVFLKYNLRGLLALARGRDDELKEWLSGVLLDCAETREKRALERALEKRK